MIAIARREEKISIFTKIYEYNILQIRLDKEDGATILHAVDTLPSPLAWKQLTF